MIGLCPGANTIVDYQQEMTQIDQKLKDGNLMIHCNKCQNRMGQDAGRKMRSLTWTRFSPERFLGRMALTLLKEMSKGAIMHRTQQTNATFLHMLCSRGRLDFLEVYNKAVSDQDWARISK